MTLEEGLCLPGLVGEGGMGAGGAALFIIQPAEITSSSFSRGQICAILKKKSCDLLTVLNG